MTSFAEITGLLDRAQNPDALLTDGTRALTGHLSVASGITVDGVDISAFQSAYQAHLGNPTAHSYVRNILDDASAAVDRGALTNDVRIYGADGISVTKTSTGLRISGSGGGGGGGGGGGTFAGIKDPSGAAAVPDGFNYISLTVSNQVSITASTNALAFALVPGNINHQDLGGLGADDHHAAFVGLKVGATTINPDGSDVITIAAGTNATVVAGSNTVTIGVSSTPAFTSVTVSGNISVSGTVDGVDISTHAANANAHHNQQHALAGGDHTASGLTAGQVLRASGSTTFAWAQLAHGDLSSIGTNTHAQIDTHIGTADTHVAHSGVTLTAGNGLTGGGTIAASHTFTLGTPTSLSATSTNSVTSTSHTHTIDSTIARSAITIVAGLGLTGGGDLAANRTIALSTPGSLSATSTNNATGNHTHVIDSSIARSAITISAGNGMSGGGNLTANRTLAVNQDYDFNWTGLHTFNEHTEMESVDVNGALTVFDDLSVFNGGYYPLFVNVDTVNPNNSNVGIMTNTPDPQFALDVAGPLRAQYLIGPHAIQLSDAAMICHFDGPYPFETNYDGFAAGHLGQVATETGGVIYRPGKFGKAVQLAEATTNLVANPSFEVSTSGWSSSWGDTVSRSTEQAKYGLYSLKIAADGSTNGQGAFRDTTVTAGQTYTISCWVYVPSSYTGTDPSPRVYDGANFTTPLGAVAITERDQWVYWSTTQTITSTTIRFLLFANANAAAGQAFYLDGIQIEAKAYATPYCDGSLGSGHTWSGTAHASTSSRTATTITYNGVGVDADGATWMAWIYPTSAGSYQVIASQTNGALSEGWELSNSSGTARVTLRNPTANITAGALTLNAWNHVAATYDRTTLRLYLNGVETGNTAATQSVATTNALALGYRPGGSTFNGLIDEFVLLNRAADAAEIRSIYESNAPVFAESSIEVWRTPTQVPIWVDSEGLWMRATGGGETLGAYGGAATKSWGGKTLYQSDFLLGNATNGYIHWHAFQNPADPYGAAGMEVRARVDVLGESQFIGAVTLGASGGIYQGTGTFASPTTGLRLWNDSGIGRIGGYNSGALQWYGSTDGRLYGAGGNAYLDANGLHVRARQEETPTFNSVNGIIFDSPAAYAASVSEVGMLYTNAFLDGANYEASGLFQIGYGPNLGSANIYDQSSLTIRATTENRTSAISLYAAETGVPEFSLLALDAAKITINGTSSVDVVNGANRSGSSNGVFTVNNGLLGFTLWSYAGLAGTAQTIIPDGSNDVSNGAVFFYWVDPSSGFSDGGFTSCANNQSNYLWNNGSDQVSISIASNGALTVQRTSGSLTYNVALAILWI